MSFGSGSELAAAAQSEGVGIALVQGAGWLSHACWGDRMDDSGGKKRFSSE